MARSICTFKSLPPAPIMSTSSRRCSRDLCSRFGFYLVDPARSILHYFWLSRKPHRGRSPCRRNSQQGWLLHALDHLEGFHGLSSVKGHILLADHFHYIDTLGISGRGCLSAPSWRGMGSTYVKGGLRHGLRPTDIVVCYSTTG